MANSSVQGFVHFSDGSWAHLYNTAAGAAFTDTTEAEIYVRGPGGNAEQLWRSHLGKRIRRIAIQTEDGGVVTTVKIYNPDSGVMFFFRGSERNITSVVQAEAYNLNIKGLDILVTKGLAIKCNVTT